jgi:hypothetical protein
MRHDAVAGLARDVCAEVDAADETAEAASTDERGDGAGNVDAGSNAQHADARPEGNSYRRRRLAKRFPGSLLELEIAKAAYRGPITRCPLGATLDWLPRALSETVRPASVKF